MKTLDEATRKIFPSYDNKTIDDFVLMRGKGIMEELILSAQLREILSTMCAGSLTTILQGQNPMYVFMGLAKECVCLGIAIGIEMEKNDNATVG